MRPSTQGRMARYILRWSDNINVEIDRESLDDLLENVKLWLSALRSSLI